jgi:imidazoleglycerol-phosphate dehydratase/histidinol-phosphatase
MQSGQVDLANSYVIGDRQTDIGLAENLCCEGILYDNNWSEIVTQLTTQNRSSEIVRNTNETQIAVRLNLDSGKQGEVMTGLGFF